MVRATLTGPLSVPIYPPFVADREFGQGRAGFHTNSLPDPARIHPVGAQELCFAGVKWCVQ